VGRPWHRSVLAASALAVSTVVPASPPGSGSEARLPADSSAGKEGFVSGLNFAPVDLSFLDAADSPAGKHGFLRTRGDQLVFEDGTVARFWGANLTAHSLFDTPSDDVKLQAHRLSQLGFNIVRIHHHDSDWVDPNIFGDAKADSTRNLSSAMLERLDWWIKCLGDEGIYVWLDLEVGRRLKSGDGIEGFDEIRRGKHSAGLAGYSYVNDSIRSAMQRFNEAYLDHRNVFTNLRYKEDPAIVALLISNENDLTNHYGNALLPRQNVPWHTAIYLKEAAGFAAAHGLKKGDVWRSWEPGPSKLFLNDLEHRFDIDMIGSLHRLGIGVPVVTTSTWGGNPLSSLPALTAGDMVDVHSYGGPNELGSDPARDANFLDWISAAHVIGKPLTVTEWGVGDQGTFAADRQDMPLYVSASACLQGWNAVMFFAYAVDPLVNGRAVPSIYQVADDPVLLAVLPAAALLYRQSHVREAATVYVFAPNEDTLFNHAVSAANSPAIRTAAERGKLLVALPQVPELPWLAPSVIPKGVQIIRDAGTSLLTSGASEATSDSGELRRNWKRGFFTIDTPRSEAAMGWIGGTAFLLHDVTLKLSTRDGVVAVQALDEKPINQSRDILISIAASASADSKSPSWLAQPMVGEVSITAPPGLHLSRWDSGTAKAIPLPAPPYIHGRYALSLGESLRSNWLLLTSTPTDVAVQ
jgi:hypothetical protein